MADSLVGHCVRFTMAIIHHLFFFFVPLFFAFCSGDRGY